MSDFRILTNVSSGVLRFVDRIADTHVGVDGAYAAITRSAGTTNPLHKLAFSKPSSGIFRPTLWEHTTSRVVRGDGASAFDDAVSGLHQLAGRHNVGGISLSPNPNQYGALMRRGDARYATGEQMLRQLGDGDVVRGRDIAFRIDAAARRVLDFVDPIKP